MKFLKKIKELYEKDKIFFLIVFAVFIVQFGYLSYHMSQFESIPTCTYGCAGWMSQGFLKDLISNPTNLWKNDGLTYENFPAVLPKGTEYLMLGLYKVFGPIFGWDFFNSWKVIIPLTLISFAFFFFLCFNILYKLSKQKELALIFTLIFNSLIYYPIYQYSSLKFLPVFLMGTYLLYYSYQKSFSYKSTLFYIPLLIFAFHLHPGVALSLSLIYGFAIILNYFKDAIKLNVTKILKDNFFQKTIIIVAIAGIISVLMPWWFHVLFLSEGNLGQNLKLNDSVDFENPSTYFSYIFVFIKSFFWNSSNTLNLLLSLLLYLGLFALYFQKFVFKKNVYSPSKEMWLITTSFLFSFLFVAYHYLITAPIFGTELASYRISVYTQVYLRYLLAFNGILFLFNFLRVILKSNPLIKLLKNNFTKNSLVVIVLLLLLIPTISSLENRKNDSFYSKAYNVENNYEIQMYKNLYYDYFAKNNIEPESTILISTNEVSMAVHNIVGVDIINGRYGYYYQYVDYEPYWLDTALILYSNNSQTRKDLLSKYSSKKELYLYWDYNWINTEFFTDSNGQVVGFSNPLKFYSTEAKNTLKQNNISTLSYYDSFEPNTYGKSDFRKFDLAIVAPNNYRRNSYQVWNEDLDQYLTEVWSYEINGQRAAILYKVTIN